MGIDAAKQPNVRPVMLAEIAVALSMRGAVLTTSQTITYEYATAEKITSAKIDGTALTERSSIANVEANPGSFYNDRAAGKLYVSASSGSVFSKSVVAIAAINVASKEKVFGSDYYDPRMTGIPRLSMRIEQVFGGVGQISIGSIGIANLDGDWDGRADYLWANADTTVTLKIGWDTRTEDMAYGNYAALGIWGVNRWQITDKTFSIDLREKKARLDLQVPIEVFDKTTYPSMDDDDVGEPIPRAYGKVFGARPILIDESSKQFKVAGHAIKAFDEIRLKVDDAWTTSSFTTTDEANGEFTCSAWVDGNEVSVDFKGRKNADETLMDNAADVVEDLMLYAGISAADINSSAITEAFNRLDNGLFEATGLRGTLRALSLYLNEQESLVDILSRINAAVGSFLYVDAAGTFHYKVFWPTPGDSLNSYDETECLSFAPTVESDELASKVNARYAHRRNDDWWSLETVERTENQYQHLVEVAEVLTADLEELSEDDDAKYWAQRHLVSAGLPRRLYKVRLPAVGLDIVPGDQFRVVNSRRGFDEVLEVLRAELDFDQGIAALVLGDLRRWGREAGFWATDGTISFPSRLGGGTITSWSSAWSDDQKAWARQNVGFWTDANGFADSADPDSLISTWF